MKRSDSTLPCPRCGYDQRGVAATWTDAWPLSGTCTECGLEFAWGPVIAPQKFEPKWCIEYADTRRRFLGNAWRTFWRSLWPWRFWSRLQMSHAIRWKRLLAYVLLVLIGPFLLVYVAEQATVAVLVRANMPQQMVQQQKAAVAGLAQLQAFLQSTQFSTLPPDQQRFYQRRAAQLQSATAQDISIDQPYVSAIIEAVFMPTSESTGGSMSDSFATYPYVTPSQLHAVAIHMYWSTLMPGQLPDYDNEALAIFITGLLMNLIIAAFLPLGFVFLPISRKRAKVRWRHVVRVMLYGVVMHTVVLWIGALAIAGAPLYGTYEGFAYGLAILSSTVGLLLALNIWWAVAIKRYLKMPHGWAIAPLLTIVAVLLPSTVMFNLGTMSPGSAIAVMLVAVVVGGGMAVVVLADQRRARQNRGGRASRPPS